MALIRMAGTRATASIQATSTVLIEIEKRPIFRCRRKRVQIELLRRCLALVTSIPREAQKPNGFGGVQGPKARKSPPSEAYLRYAAVSAGCSATPKLGFRAIGRSPKPKFKARKSPP